MAGDDSTARVDTPFLEVCVDTLAGARAAIAGGAHRIELCSALTSGGLTPAAGLVDEVLAAARDTAVTVRAMVRPGAGGFDLDATMLAVAIADARALLRAGVDGLVFGATRDGAIDEVTLGRWRDAIGGATGLTFHRAIDTLADPVAAVDRVIALGYDQILTSGGARTAAEGASTIAAMVARASGRCRIVAGSGVRPANAAAIIAAARTRSLHASARAIKTGDTVADPFGFGVASPPADASITRQLRAAVDNASP